MNRLAIEVDGAQHFEPEGLAADEVRTQYLVARGIRVLRFTNLEVLREIEGVMVRVLESIEGTPSP
jgi:very-short-patch-repair endonuclease